MALTVNNNIAALNAYRNLSSTQNDLNSSLEKLSSGYRINRAADDAAGLSISEGLRSQIGGLTVAVRNAQDGISVAQTAEGALTEVTDMLQRMNDLAVQYNNGTQNADSQAALQAEFDALETEIGRIGTNTTFNGVDLFGGSALTFQTGYASSDTIDISATALADFTAGTAMAAIDITDSDTLQAAITEVSAQRSELGAVQNRFEHTIANLNVTVENLTASESRIRDTDMAAEMVDFTSAQILSQAGTAMLAQAKSIPQGVLSLLQ
ncbi:flagellin [Demequina sp. NBRC 110054]|uniref:flagellin N-terminal helical domain-containing protein n=1 Tax=Demequina sp. NBRC 110054 TaxID=1570343 RepID=UPI000A030120|nr:flagellin [Demequina sp. NBRC 110054]